MEKCKTIGHVRPIPETADLWADLKKAKTNSDRVEMGRLSDRIRRATVDAKVSMRDSIGGDSVGGDSISATVGDGNLGIAIGKDIVQEIIIER